MGAANWFVGALAVLAPCFLVEYLLRDAINRHHTSVSDNRVSLQLWARTK